MTRKHLRSVTIALYNEDLKVYVDAEGKHLAKAFVAYVKESG